MKHSISVYCFRLILTLLIAMLCSCQKFVSLDLPSTMIQKEVVFATDETATAAVQGLYANIISSNLTILNGGATLYPALSADELTNTAPNEDFDGFRNNNIAPTSILGLQTRLWAKAYTTVYHTNAIIEGLQASSTLSPEVKNRLLGETKTIRAFLYFYLVNFFGDLPLITDTNFEDNAKRARSKTTEVWKQIKEDLLNAISLLSPSYNDLNRSRINKWAAMTLLARVYLYSEDWDNAATAASAVIQSGTYTLSDHPANVFLPASPETILQWTRESSNTAEGASFIPSSPTGRPPFALIPVLLNDFETGDKRKTAWIKTNTVNGVIYHYPFKYKVRTATTVSEYLIVFRLAELYLIRAEAKAHREKWAEASEDLSILRNRAGLPSIALQTLPELRTMIEHERRIEFFTEWGHRWLDLKRTERAEAVLAPLKAPHWQPSDLLYPLPLQELQRAPQLEQNPGY